MMAKNKNKTKKTYIEHLDRRRAKAKAKREAAAKAKLKAENTKTFDDFKDGKFLVVRSMPIPLYDMRIIHTPDFGYLDVLVRNGIKKGAYFQYLNTVTDYFTGRSTPSIVAECVVCVSTFGRQVRQILIGETSLKQYIGSGAISLATDDEAKEMTQWLNEHHREKGNMHRVIPLSGKPVNAIRQSQGAKSISDLILDKMRDVAGKDAFPKSLKSGMCPFIWLRRII